MRSALLISGLISALMAQDAGVVPASGIARAQTPEAYMLHPGDEIALHSLEAKEIAEKAYRLDEEGQVNFPLIGRIRLANLTARQAEELLRSKFKTYYVEPDLELNVTTFHTETFSVIGSIGNPGVRELKGRITLLDALSLGGGVRAEAGPVVIVTRQAASGTIPLRTAHSTFSGESVVEINLKNLLDGVNPDENIVIQPRDMISIPPAQIVYVIGNVKHAGGFTLSGRTSLTVLQALSLAEGMDPRASPERTRILRHAGQPEQQIAVNVKKILKGEAEDIVLQPNDILFVPSSATRVITQRTIEAAITVGTGLAIFAH
jgi:polysaccharide export outer membrane protein